MPTTRTRARARSQAINVEQHEKDDTVERSHPTSPKASGSGRATQHCGGNNGDDATNPRSAKRRRTDDLRDPSPAEVAETDIHSVDEAKEVLGHFKGPMGGTAVAPVLSTSGKGELPEQQKQACMDSSGRHLSSRHSSTLRDLTKTRIENLPALDKLARQILSTHAMLSPQEFGSLIANSTSDVGREYINAQSEFARTKQQYSRDTFLSSSSLCLQESAQIATLRKVNLATFVSSLFSGQIGLEELDRHFIEVFVPEEGRLLKVPGSLWLELKTQAFIASMVTSDARPSKDVLAHLFSENIEEQMLSRRPGAKGLAPSEHDFLERMTSRRDFLAAEMSKEPAGNLPAKYKWEKFLRETSLYVGKTFESLSPRSETNANPNITQQPEMQRGKMEGSFSIYAVAPQGGSTTFDPSKEDFVARAARAAHIALQSPGPLYPMLRPTPPPQRSISPPQYQVQPTFQHYTPPSSSISNPRPANPPTSLESSDIPHISQTAPTKVLYERARIANKPFPSSKKLSPSQRRPWTSEEEQTLMEGLDRVRGPHWSQILSMFGAGGRENEKLKDRNQVQLKDKARNLKLFFLKSGIEVPFYLKNVTGDLKARAPMHAANLVNDQVGRDNSAGVTPPSGDAHDSGSGRSTSTRSEESDEEIQEGLNAEIAPDEGDGNVVRKE